MHPFENPKAYQNKDVSVFCGKSNNWIFIMVRKDKHEFQETCKYIVV